MTADDQAARTAPDELCGLLADHGPHAWELLVDQHRAVPRGQQARWCVGAATPRTAPAARTDLAEAEQYARTAVSNRLHRTPPEFLARVLEEYERRGTEIEAFRYQVHEVMEALNAEGDDPVSAASFTRQAADAFASKLAEAERRLAAVRALAEGQLRTARSVRESTSGGSYGRLRANAQIAAFGSILAALDGPSEASVPVNPWAAESAAIVRSGRCTCAGSWDSECPLHRSETAEQTEARLAVGPAEAPVSESPSHSDTVSVPPKDPQTCSKCGTTGCAEDAESGWYDDGPAEAAEPATTGHMIAPGVPCRGCQTCLVPGCERCAVGETCAEHDPTEEELAAEAGTPAQPRLVAYPAGSVTTTPDPAAVIAAALAYADDPSEATGETPTEDALLDAVNAYRAALAGNATEEARDE